LKKLNLDDIDKQAAFFIYLVNKARMDVALTYNLLSTGMANNHPLQSIDQRLRADFPTIYGNASSLAVVIQQIEGNFSSEMNHCKPSIEILSHIVSSLNAIGGEPPQNENLTGFIARSLTLLGLVFGDLQRLEEEFVRMCDFLGISYVQLQEWIEDDPINLSIEETNEL
jgi:hypothetical protein